MSGVNDNTWGFQTILANIKKVVTVPFSYQIKGDTDSLGWNMNIMTNMFSQYCHL